MTENYPEYEINAEVEVVANDDYLRGTVIGINYTCPVYMYIVHLDSPIDGEFGQQTGLYVPEGVLVGIPDLNTLTSLETMGSYVSTTEDGAVDVKVIVASPVSQDEWYVLLSDPIDGIQLMRFSPFDTKDEAVEVATTILEENHEAAPGENAEQYLARISSEGGHE
jgi:hypothetical protein